MKPLHPIRRALPLLGLLLIAAAAAAQDLPGISLPAAGAEPVTITADQVTWLRDKNLLVFDGHVVVTHPQYLVEAARAEAEIDSRTILVSGGVRITAADGSELTADEAKIGTDSGQAWLVKARLTVPWDEQRFAFRGDRFERTADGSYLVTRGSFTWCACEGEEPPDWSVSADSLKVDPRGDLQARGATINLRDHPVFRVPWFRYPVGLGRRSGFLPPVVATSSRNGIEVEIPWYQTIGPSADATLQPRWIQNRGVDAGAELRYNLGDAAAGQANGFGIDDRAEHAARGGAHVIHRTDLADRLSLAADAAWITDNEVLYDFDHRNLGNEHARMLESSLYLSLHDPAGQNLTVELSAFDDLMGGDLRESTLGSRDRDLFMPQRLPALRYTLLTRRLAGPLFFDLDAQAVNLYRQEAEFGAGQLYAFTPRLVLPARVGGAVDLWAAAGWREWYAAPHPEFDEDARLSGTPVAELSASAEWERVSESGARVYRHTLRPEFLAYFSGEPPELGGMDYVGLYPAEELSTVGVRLDSRLWSRPAAGRRNPTDTARLTLTQLYDFHDQEWRDLYLQARLGKPSPVSFALDAYQGWEGQELSRLVARVGYDYGVGEASIGYRYGSEDAVRAPYFTYDYLREEAVTGSVSWRPAERHELTYRAYYSLLYDRMVRQSIDYDFTARQRCWGLNLRVADRIRPTDPEGEHELSGYLNLRLEPPSRQP